MNLSALNNITPFEVNTSLINNSADIASNLTNNANDGTGGYFGLGIMLVVAIMILIITTQDQEVFRLNFVQAFVASTGIALLIGIIGITTEVFTNFQHVVWFAVLFAIALISAYYQKRGGV